MFKGAKVIRILPDQPGRGGWKTSVSTQSKVFDTRKVVNCTAFLGHWQANTKPAANLYYNTPAAMTGITMPSDTSSQSLYNFPVVSTVNPALSPTNHLMEHLQSASASTPYQNMIVDHNAAFPLVDWSVKATSDFVAGLSHTVPATFLAVKNRCFICWGATNTVLYPNGFNNPGTVANNIISDPNRSSTVYDIGVEAPASASTYTFSGAVSGTTSVTTGSNKVNNATVTGNWSASTQTINLGGIPYQVINPGGYVTTFAVGGTCTGTGGTATLTINAFHFPVNGDWNGLTINIAAPNAESVVIASYVPAGANTTVTLTTNLANNHAGAAYTVTGEELVLTTGYSAATNLVEDYTASAGVLSWTGAGPQYAYAFYDPNTGHVSNISPVMTVVEQNQTNINVVVSNIMYSQDHDAIRFTKILVFRSLAGGGVSGGVLYPIGDGNGNFFTLNNTGPFGAGTSFTDNNSDDFLLRNGGLIAPLNNDPPIGPFAHMMYWDDHIWGNPTSDPTGIYFSSDITQTPFGVKEESFPGGNILRIPSDDGRVTGMRLIGGVGVITTNRYAYYIVGNNAQNYRLARFATTTFGVADKQMAEFAGDTDVNSAALMYVGGDSKVYMLAPSYGNVSVSEPIQDQLYQIFRSQQGVLSQARVVQALTTSQKFLLVSSIFGLSSPGRVIFLYDFDRKIWTQHLPTDPNTGQPLYFSSFTNVYQPQSGASIDFLCSSQGTIYSWLLPITVPAVTLQVDAAYVETFPIDFGRKSHKQLDQVRLYCSNAIFQDPNNPGSSQNWTVQVVANEDVLPQYGSLFVPVVNQDPNDQLQGPSVGASGLNGSPFPVDDPYARELVINFPSGTTTDIIGHRFTIRVNFPTANVVAAVGQFNPYNLYAFDVIATDLEEPDEESN